MRAMSLSRYTKQSILKLQKKPNVGRMGGGGGWGVNAAFSVNVADVLNELFYIRSKGV